MRLLTALPLALLSLSGSALAEDQPVVVELFTSQGCSACPPADAMLQEIAEMDGVIALALHVDYWDYIGWPDSFASPGHSARQEAYAKAARDRMIYTPQVVVNGQDRVVGSDPVAVMESLRAHSGVEAPVALTVTREGDGLRISAEGSEGPAEVHLVRYMPEAHVAIEGGENAGLAIDYANVVTDWQVLEPWAGGAAFEALVPLAGDEPAVVLVQEPGAGRILAAAEVR
jgi:hypothetical protein